MLDSYFNFTKKYNLVGDLQCDFLKNWLWLTFLGHPVYLKGSEEMVEDRTCTMRFNF